MRPCFCVYRVYLFVCVCVSVTPATSSRPQTGLQNKTLKQFTEVSHVLHRGGSPSNTTSATTTTTTTAGHLPGPDKAPVAVSACVSLPGSYRCQWRPSRAAAASGTRCCPSGSSSAGPCCLWPSACPGSRCGGGEHVYLHQHTEPPTETHLFE